MPRERGAGWRDVKLTLWILRLKMKGSETAYTAGRGEEPAHKKRDEQELHASFDLDLPESDERYARAHEVYDHIYRRNSLIKLVDGRLGDAEAIDMWIPALLHGDAEDGVAYNRYDTCSDVECQGDIDGNGPLLDVVKYAEEQHTDRGSREQHSKGEEDIFCWVRLLVDDELGEGDVDCVVAVVAADDLDSLNRRVGKGTDLDTRCQT